MGQAFARADSHIALQQAGVLGGESKRSGSGLPGWWQECRKRAAGASWITSALLPGLAPLTDVLGAAPAVGAPVQEQCPALQVAIRRSNWPRSGKHRHTNPQRFVTRS